MSLADLADAGFDLLETTNHADAILSRDFRAEFDALCGVLLSMEIECTEMMEGGGNEAPPTRRLRRTLNDAGWRKRNIDVTKSVDGTPRSSTTHEIDHVRDCDLGTLALEIEWNNKDPFFDRDLENFQRLHADGAISVGIVVTRGRSLQTNIREILIVCAKANNLHSTSDFRRLGIKEPTANQRAQLGRLGADTDFARAAGMMMATKYGESTTHWNKLTERLDRGVGNPCPLLLVGPPATCVTVVSGAGISEGQP